MGPIRQTETPPPSTHPSIVSADIPSPPKNPVSTARRRIGVANRPTRRYKPSLPRGSFVSRGGPKARRGRGGGVRRARGSAMPVSPLLSRILDDEALIRGLGDAEARVLVEWLVEQAERLEETRSPERADDEVRRLCRRGRAVARFVMLWCHRRRPRRRPSARGRRTLLLAAAGRRRRGRLRADADHRRMGVRAARPDDFRRKNCSGRSTILAEQCGCFKLNIPVASRTTPASLDAVPLYPNEGET